MTDTMDRTEAAAAAPTRVGGDPERRPHMIVVGNEKGGAGKSTLAAHVLFALVTMGLRVGALDLDVRQRTLDRYLDNRARWSAQAGRALEMPERRRIEASDRRDLDAAEDEERGAWAELFGGLRGLDCVVVDTPGGVTHLSRLAHRSADTILTPINDSFLDFDVLGTVDPESLRVERPSQYSEMVWNSRKLKAASDKRPIDWIVVRNRLSMLDARNKRRVGEGLKELSHRIGFRIAPGVCERVIYRELFPCGLTLLDLEALPGAGPVTMSHVAARQELRDLLIVMKLPILAGEPLRF